MTKGREGVGVVVKVNADQLVQVWAGTAGVKVDDQPIRWVIVAGGTADNLQTTLRVFRGDKRLAGSGFRGRSLEPGTVIHPWSGQSSGLPFFVMARVNPTVTDVVVTTDLGIDVRLDMSGTVDRFGLRFGATDLPEGHRPRAITAIVDGETSETAKLHEPTAPG